MPRKKPRLKRRSKPTKTKVKKNRRSAAQFPALEKKYNLRSRQSQIDMDYLDRLNNREKKWLNKFVSEEVNADFRHKNHFNKAKYRKKICYDRNNARNRCVLVKQAVSGDIENLANIKNEPDPSNLDERIQQDKRIEVLQDIQDILKRNPKLKKRSRRWYKRGEKPEDILTKLKKLDNFNNTLDRANKSQKPT